MRADGSESSCQTWFSGSWGAIDSSLTNSGRATTELPIATANKNEAEW